MDSFNNLEIIYSVCNNIIGKTKWDILVNSHDFITAESLPEIFLEKQTELILPEYLADLAFIEYARYCIANATVKINKNLNYYEINPALDVLHLSWSNLAHFFNSNNDVNTIKPSNNKEWIIVWRAPSNCEVNIKSAKDYELFVLKMLVDDLSVDDVIKSGNITSATVEKALLKAVASGIVIAPE